MLTGLSFMIMIATITMRHVQSVTGYERNIFVETTVSKKEH